MFNQRSHLAIKFTFTKFPTVGAGILIKANNLTFSCLLVTFHQFALLIRGSKIKLLIKDAKIKLLTTTPLLQICYNPIFPLVGFSCGIIKKYYLSSPVTSYDLS